MEKFLCLYAQEQTNFRVEELRSVIDLFGIKAEIDLSTYDAEKPFLFLYLHTLEEARLILSRSVLLRCIIQLWGYGSKIPTMLKSFPGIYKMAQTFSEDKTSTFSFRVEAFNKKLSMDEKKEWIQELESEKLDFGEVDLKNPKHCLYLLLDFIDKGAGKTLNQMFFGELVGHSQRQMIQQYSLKTRYFIGNTSMDPQLSFIMANQGKVRKGSLVYDPFVGTGSILTCCAHFGAVTAGSDIDYSIVYGRGKSSRAGQNGWRARDEIIRTNYQNYGLLSQFLDIMAADITRLPLREQEIFDAIITDPPYGIREGGRKQSEPKNVTTTERGADNFPAIEKQNLSGIILSLIECAARYLVAGGRLVYWLPVYKPSYTEDVVPAHPCFKLVANNEQPLTKKISRRLITMEKIYTLERVLQTDDQSEKFKDWKHLHDQFRDNYFKKEKSE